MAVTAHNQLLPLTDSCSSPLGGLIVNASFVRPSKMAIVIMFVEDASRYFDDNKSKVCLKPARGGGGVVVDARYSLGVMLQLRGWWGEETPLYEGTCLLLLTQQLRDRLHGSI